MGCLYAWFAVALLAAAASAQGAEKVKSGTHEVTLDKAPGWALPRLESAAAPPAEALAATSYALVDTQIDWRGPQSVFFVRIIMRVTNNESLKQAGEITLDFDPSYQKLTLHEVTIRRGGDRLNRLDPKSVRVVQQERELQTNRLLTGRANAIVVISDVRIGDQVEYAFTVTGDNPIMGTKRATSLPQAYGVYVEKWRARILSGPQRTFNFKSFMGGESLQKTSRGAYDEYLLVKSNVRAVTPDPKLARWFNPWARAQVSEYDSWAEVAAWGETLFPASATPSSVATLAADLRRDAASDEETAARALRFVQEEIRYLSVAIGQNAFRAADPVTVLERRYGDCKDKVNLLIALLRRMGFEAWPALVSNQAQHRIADLLPAPVFDHVIAIIRVHGRDYWVDPTENMQGAKLERMRAGRYGYALVLRPGAVALTPQPDAAMPTNELAVTETIIVKDYKQPARMTFELAASGQEASDLRRAVAAGMMEMVMTFWNSSVERVYPRAKPLGAFSVADDPAADRFVLTQIFELADFLFYSNRMVYVRVQAPGIADYLQLSPMSNRDWPLALGRPGTYRHSVRIELPENIVSPLQPSTYSDADSLLSFSQTLDLAGRVAAVHWTVTVKRDHVLGDEVTRHMARRKRWGEQYVAGLRVTPVSLQDFAKKARGRLDQRIAALTKTRLNDTALSEIRTLRFDVEDQETQYLLDRFSFEPKERAVLLVEHAILLNRQGKWADALKSLDEALTIDPDSPGPFFARGELLTYQGRFKEALEDFDRAEKLGGDVHRLAFSRGQARYYAGDFAGAAADFKASALAAAENQKFWPLLWLYLASARTGADAGKSVRELQPTDEKPAWPSAAVQFLIGAIDESSLRGRAKANDPVLELERRCEMLFFIGQSAALKGDRKRAREMFEAARATQAVWVAEHAYARLELERLSRNP
jgi:lipoprotein NlpI/transglutaminase-like putative cysteine protease